MSNIETVEIPDRDIGGLKTVQDVMDCISEKMTIRR